MPRENKAQVFRIETKVLNNNNVVDMYTENPCPGTVKGAVLGRDLAIANRVKYSTNSRSWLTIPSPAPFWHSNSALSLLVFPTTCVYDTLSLFTSLICLSYPACANYVYTTNRRHNIAHANHLIAPCFEFSVCGETPAQVWSLGQTRVFSSFSTGYLSFNLLVPK